MFFDNTKVNLFSYSFMIFLQTNCILPYFTLELFTFNYNHVMQLSTNNKKAIVKNCTLYLPFGLAEQYKSMSSKTMKTRKRKILTENIFFVLKYCDNFFVQRWHSNETTSHIPSLWIVPSPLRLNVLTTAACIIAFLNTMPAT